MIVCKTETFGDLSLAGSTDSQVQRVDMFFDLPRDTVRTPSQGRCREIHVDAGQLRETPLLAHHWGRMAFDYHGWPEACVL